MSTLDADDLAFLEATYLKQTDASSTYLSQADASTTYATQTGVDATYLSQADAASTYATQSGLTAAAYLSQADAIATYAEKEQVASLDEMFISAAVGPSSSAFSSGAASYFFTAPFALTVTSGWFYLYSSITASDTNYLLITLAKRRISDAVYDGIVTGHTQLTGASSWGTDLPYGYAYSWNAFEWDSAAAQLDPGDTLAFTISKVGTAAMPNGQAAVTIGYVPR